MVVKALFLAFLQGFGVKKPSFYPNLYKNCPPLNLLRKGARVLGLQPTTESYLLPVALSKEMEYKQLLEFLGVSVVKIDISSGLA